MQPQSPEYNPNKEQQRPYVQFELRATEDRTKESPDGVCQLVDVAWAIVRAPGSKDSVEKRAEDWLGQLRAYAKDGRIPPNWPREYAEAFELWKKGEEMPLHGTAIKTWPPLTPAARKAILAVGILTVEDLALSNDEVKSKIGMNANSLQQMAAKWLEESKEGGKTARELADAQIELKSLRSTVLEMQATLNQSQPPVKLKLA